MSGSLVRIIRRLLFPEPQESYEHDVKHVMNKIVPSVIPQEKDSRNFFCPDCSSKSLSIACRIELGSDSRDDEYSLQAIQCSACDMVGVATYQESRRGAGESWDHIGFRMDATSFQSLLKQLTGCKSRSKATCTCEAHNYFGVKSEYGRLEPLKKLEYDKAHFVMRLS